MKERKSIAIIGAGIAGLTMASELTDFFDIEVFEKARGIGGRLATRYAGAFLFDHGAPFITARSKKFQKYIRILIESGHIAQWKGKVITLEEGAKIKDRLWFEPHYVAAPNMNNFCKVIAQNHRISLNTQIEKIERQANNKFSLWDSSGVCKGEFDCVVSTAPPIQTINLLGDYIPSNNFIRNIEMVPKFALMLGLDSKWDKSWIAAKVQNSAIDWIYINSTKPKRNCDITTIIATTGPEFSIANINQDAEEIGELIFADLVKLLKIKTNNCFKACHKWRYALPPFSENSLTLWEKDIGIGAVGDWCGGQYSPIENSWLAANKLAREIQKAR